MDYSLSGHFIEACDCTVICPCWVDDEPVGGHCTGLVAWSVEEGVIGETDVAGSMVVSVSTHGGFRRDGSQTTTVLYIDPPDDQPEKTEDRVTLLAKAFSGGLDGPLAGLADVSGTVVGHDRAHIDIEHGPKGRWEVTVRPDTAPASPAVDVRDNPDDIVIVRADGMPTIFDREHGNDNPLVLRHTALSHELGVPPPRRRGRGPAGRPPGDRRRGAPGRQPPGVGTFRHARQVRIRPSA